MIRPLHNRRLLRIPRNRTCSAINGRHLLEEVELKLSHQAAVAASMLAAASAHAADWSDTAVQLRYGTNFAEPGIGTGIRKTVVNLTHVSGDRLGTNLFVGDLLMSDDKDPAAGSTSGAQEFYGLYQRTFSINALAHRKGGFGFAKDLSILTRVDLSSKNHAFASAVRKLRVGLTASLPVGAGFWDAGINIYKERHHNGIVGRWVTMKAVPEIATAWAVPVMAGATFRGYASLLAPRGRDGFGVETKSEFHGEAHLMFDIGGSGSGWKAGVGYEYWRNKFGVDARTTPGAKASTPLLLAEYHF
jgi:hypothetical protein